MEYKWLFAIILVTATGVCAMDPRTFPTYPIEKHKEPKHAKRAPFLCPIDVEPGYQVYAALIANGGFYELNYWHKLTHIQNSLVADSSKHGVVGIRSDQKRFVLLVFGIDNIRRAQNMKLHEHAQKIADRTI